MQTSASEAGAVHVDPLPPFVTGAGEADWLLWSVGIFLLAAVVGGGALFLTIHSLPERIAHRSKKLQLEIVAVLCLLALFTHVHLFWVAALVLALVDLPDISTPLHRAAAALERIAGLPQRAEDAEDAPTGVGADRHGGEAAPVHDLAAARGKPALREGAGSGGAGQASAGS